MKQSLRTLLAQAGHFIDEVNGSVVPPIQPSTTFARDENYLLRNDFIYSRYNNPTFEFVEELATKLDDGEDALLFGSGMSAIASIFETVNSGEHVVAPKIMYHGAQNWLKRISIKRNFRITFFDTDEPDSLESSIIPNETKILWIESPVNPTWDVIDIEKTASLGHGAGATVIVDSTVSPPVTTQALSMGADMVFHSATKYMNGHSDVLAGIVVTNSKNDLWEEIKEVRKYLGSVIGPFEAWLLLRGMRTLSLRFEKISDNAMKFSQHFENHPKVEKVLYPGLKSHKGHEIAKKQMINGYGGMISMLIQGTRDQAISIIKKLELFVPATSLGGVESLVEHRATVEGSESEVVENLLRLSIGIEDVNDLISDFENALDKL